MVDRLDALAGIRDGFGVLHVSWEPTDTIECQAVGFATAEYANRFPTGDELFYDDMAQKATAPGYQVAHVKVLVSDNYSVERDASGTDVGTPNFRAAQSANSSRLIFTL